MSLVLEIKLSELNVERSLVSHVRRALKTRFAHSVTTVMVKPELLDAHRRTEFVVDLPDRQTVICHGERNAVIEQILSEHAAKTGAFITAHNPRSQRLSERENRERHRLLIADVEKHGLAYLTGRGVSEDHSWPAEESVFVIGANHDQATELGTKYGQLAIVWIEMGRSAQIVLC